GKSAILLDPREVTEGNLGPYTPGGPALLISETGSAEELVRLAGLLRGSGSTLIGILGDRTSPLAAQVDLLLDASPPPNPAAADPRRLISFVVATALTDALVFALKQGNHSATVNRCFSAARRSANLRLRVADVMHRGDAIPKVGLHDTIRDVVLAMTQHPLGAV